LTWKVKLSKSALPFLATHIAYVLILTNHFHNAFGDFLLVASKSTLHLCGMCLFQRKRFLLMSRLTNFNTLIIWSASLATNCCCRRQRINAPPKNRRTSFYQSLFNLIALLEGEVLPGFLID